jgi:hypothetical protein
MLIIVAILCGFFWERYLEKFEGECELLLFLPLVRSLDQQQLDFLLQVFNST